MEVVHTNCCGLHIHKKLIVACAIVHGLMVNRGSRYVRSAQ
jgi:hypothetical protein